MIPFNKATVTELEAACVADALQTGRLSGDGKYTAKVYEQLKQRFGFRNGLLTTSGTTALEMAALLTQNEQLFAGGTLTEDQKDMFFEAVSRAYFMNKERAREKFGRKAPKKQMD